MSTVPHNSYCASPLALLAATLAAGIAGAQCLTEPRQHSWFGTLLLIAALASIASLIAIIRRRTLVALCCVAASFFFLGALASIVERAPSSPNSVKHLIQTGALESGQRFAVTGTIVSAVEHAPDGVHFDFEVERITRRGIEQPASGVLSLTIGAAPTSASEQNPLQLRYASRLRVLTSINREDRYRNPGVATFTEFLERKGYDATGFIKSPSFVEQMEGASRAPALALLYDWRQELERRITSSYPAETAGVLNAALLGNRHGLSRSTAERFREGGTFHVLVISGLHITFIGGVVLLIARRLTRNPLTQFVVSAVTLWSYTFAVGAEVSVTRAAFMFSFVALAPLAARHANSLNALGAAALLLLAHRPCDLFDPSFQLTFLSVVAIVLIAWPIIEGFARIGRWRPTRETPRPPSVPQSLRELSEVLFWSEKSWREVLSQSNQKYRLFKSPLAAVLERWHLQALLRYSFCAVVVSLSVQLLLLPVQVIYFHRLSLASIILNIGVSVLMAVISLLAIAALALSLISSTVVAPLIAVVDGLNWLMIHSVDPFSALRVGSVRLPEYSGMTSAVYFCYFAVLSALCVKLKRWNPVGPYTPPRNRVRFHLCIALQSLFVLVLVLHPFSADTTRGELRIDFLDVGQGDAALVTMPDTTTLLIDAGGQPKFLQRSTDSAFERDVRSVGDAVVSEFLWQRGLDHVDYILASHADADHMDGLSDVAKNFSIRAALLSRTPAADAEYQRLSTALSARRISTSLIGAGDTLRFGEVSATVLAPMPASADAASRNNDSVVLRIQFGSQCVLFTGDLEGPGEKLLLSQTENLRCGVLKVAHHGSKTSSTPAFVNATQPQFAVIPVGRRSTFGHPHKEVVDRWNATGAKVLTTGGCGTITITSDGRDIRVDTFVPNCR